MVATLVVEGEHGHAVRVPAPPGVLTAWEIYAGPPREALNERGRGRPTHLQVTGTDGRRRLLVLPPYDTAGMVFELGSLSQQHCWDLARHMARNVVSGTLGIEPRAAVVQQWVGAVKTVCVLLERFPALSDAAREGSACPSWVAGTCPCDQHCLGAFR